MTSKFIKWFSLVASVLFGTKLVLDGDMVTGGGLITSALSSASILPGVFGTPGK